MGVWFSSTLTESCVSVCAHSLVLLGCSSLLRLVSRLEDPKGLLEKGWVLELSLRWATLELAVDEQTFSDLVRFTPLRGRP